LLERRAAAVREALSAEESPLDGFVVVATCNRFEVYGDSERFHDSAVFITETIDRIVTQDETSTNDVFEVLHGTELVRHAFGVTAGLESLVVGETEIAGQVKRALHSAQESGTATTELHSLFQSASSIAKQLLTSNELGVAGRSIASVALNHANALLANRETRTAIVIGTGAFARVGIAELRRMGFEVHGVFSPSNRANSFAERHELVALDRPALVQSLHHVDLVFSASGHEQVVLDTASVRDAAQQRSSKRPLILVDLALARDIDTHVTSIEGVHLVDLDLLQQIVPSTISEKVLAAEQFVTESVSKFEASRRGRNSGSTVTALRTVVADQVATEVETVRSRAGDDVAREVERSLRRFANSLLHLPSVRAFELASNGRDEEYRKAVHLLFGVEESTND
jgi:glutamyl-tRNA reductase